jgi:Uma2 family endonuclease
MGIPNKKFITPEEYLEKEAISLDKHEYFQGEVFAMSGASISHNVISMNCSFDLKLKLKGKPCKPYGSDLRVHIPANTLYTYPDLSVICNEIEKTNDKFDTIKNPTVIFEILSKSTRNYDQGEKFALYRQIESLKDYILIDTDEVKVIKHSKNTDNSWNLIEYKSINDAFLISSLGIEMELTSIYDDVIFQE